MTERVNAGPALELGTSDLEVERDTCRRRYSTTLQRFDFCDFRCWLCMCALVKIESIVRNFSCGFLPFIRAKRTSNVCLNKAQPPKTQLKSPHFLHSMPAFIFQTCPFSILPRESKVKTFAKYTLLIRRINFVLEESA